MKHVIISLVAGIHHPSSLQLAKETLDIASYANFGILGPIHFLLFNWLDSIETVYQLINSSQYTNCLAADKQSTITTCIN